MIPPAKRVQQLPLYVFQEQARLRDEALAQGRQVFDLGVGNPDGRPSEQVMEAMSECLAKSNPNPHRYAGFSGSPDLCRAAAEWYERRFTVHLDHEDEVLPLLGSKEGLYHLMQAYLDPGDGILIPTPCYPAYLGAARLCEAEIHELKLLPEHGFLARFDDVPSDIAKSSRMLLLNYPNNPTGAICELDHYRDAIAFCRENEILLVSDIAYCELSLSEKHVPHSIFELPGSRECAVEFTSLSKSHNMAGWRVGFCVGNAEAVANLGRLKGNVDFGMFLPVQRAAAVALTSDDSTVVGNRRIYRRRRDRLCKGLAALGWKVRVPPATLYVWTEIPPRWGEDDRRFVDELFRATGVLLSPGSAFGESGKGFVRISLVIDEVGIDACLSLIEESGLLEAAS